MVHEVNVTVNDVSFKVPYQALLKVGYDVKFMRREQFKINDVTRCSERASW